MTQKEKADILFFRQNGYSIPKIAAELQIPFYTVKSFLYRSRNKKEETVEQNVPMPSAVRVVQPCLYCRKDVEQLPHHKEKKFCSTECRVRWWNENKDQSQGKAMSKKTCLACSQPFRAYGNRKYCSHQCYISARFGKEARE